MTYTESELWSTIHRLAPHATPWLEGQINTIKFNSSAIMRPFAAASREVGQLPLAVDDANEIADPSDPTEIAEIAEIAEISNANSNSLRANNTLAWTTDDAARVLLLLATKNDAWNYAHELYRFGDSPERRGVLRALSLLPSSDSGLSIVKNAISSNEPTLLAASLDEYAFEHLSEEELNQAILKCVFLGLPISKIKGLTAHSNRQLAQMLAHLAHERIAAGREISLDVWGFIRKFPPEVELKAIKSELDSPIEQNRLAARRAMDALVNKPETQA